MAASTSPNATATPRSSRAWPRARGRQIATRTSAPKNVRKRTVPAGPTSSNRPLARPAPICTATAAVRTRSGAGTRPLARVRLAVRVGRDRDDSATAAGRELHPAGAHGEDRVVVPDPDAVARLEARAALAHDDLAAGHRLAGEHLHAEALALRVAAVPARPESLLMSHPRPPS